MKLPQQLSLPMMQTTWAKQIEPVISNPINQGQLLENVALANGTTVVNHQLGRQPRGWMLVSPQGAAMVYQASSQPNPTLTLTLVSSAAITTSLWVF